MYYLLPLNNFNIINPSQVLFGKVLRYLWFKLQALAEARCLCLLNLSNVVIKVPSLPLFFRVEFNFLLRLSI